MPFHKLFKSNFHFLKMKIVFTPDWFLNNDILINVVSFLVLATFFILALKSYNLSKKKSILYLGIGFLLIAIGELSTILTKIVLYYDTTVTREIGQAVITYQIVRTVDIFYYIGFFFNRLFTLFGLYLIYKTPTRKELSGEFLLILYLLFITALLSQAFFYVYHLTALLLLVMIIRHYYKGYKKEKLSNMMILVAAFSLLALSQVLFFFSKIGYFYVFAQSMQLISYAILFALVIKILKNGKKA